MSDHSDDDRYDQDIEEEEEDEDEDENDDDYYNDDDNKIQSSGSRPSRATGDIPLLERLAALRGEEEQQSVVGNKRKKSSSRSIADEDVRIKKSKAEIEKRKGKNAPTVMLSNKPVSRFRDIHNVIVRKGGKSGRTVDPRFSDLTGQLSYEKFTNNYSFLNDYQNDEIDKIKKNLKKIKGADSDVKDKLKRDMTLLKQQVDRRVRVAKESELLRETAQVEREKVRSGAKKPFFLKKSAKKDLLLEDKFNTLKKEVSLPLHLHIYVCFLMKSIIIYLNQGKLKKFLEKKRKKNASKEKKWLPQNFRIDS